MNHRPVVIPFCTWTCKLTSLDHNILLMTIQIHSFYILYMYKKLHPCTTYCKLISFTYWFRSISRQTKTTVPCPCLGVPRSQHVESLNSHKFEAITAQFVSIDHGYNLFGGRWKGVCFGTRPAVHPRFRVLPAVKTLLKVVGIDCWEFILFKTAGYNYAVFKWWWDKLMACSRLKRVQHAYSSIAFNFRVKLIVLDTVTVDVHVQMCQEWNVNNSVLSLCHPEHPRQPQCTHSTILPCANHVSVTHDGSMTHRL